MSLLGKSRQQTRIGSLRHRISIEERSTTQDSHLGQVDTWTTFLSDWAAIDPLSGRELIAAAAVQNVATHKITMRYRAGVTAGMRVKYGSRYFNIVAPPRNFHERGVFMEFEVEEGLVDG